MAKSTFVYAIYIGAPPEKVWRALLDGEFTRQYWGHENVSDWRPGSTWEHRRDDEARTVVLVGEVLEAQPERRLVITWADPQDRVRRDRHSRVTFEIEPVAEMVRLTVTHDELEEGSEMQRKISQGWPRVLSSLKSLLETGRALPTWAMFTPKRQETTMPDILHRVGIAAPPDRVFRSLTTLDGLRGWWVSEATGDPAASGIIDFGFCRMQVLEAVPGKRVRWRCVEGPPEWVGTEVTFALSWKDEQTFVLFTHSGWKEPVEFMHHCSTKWATFLLSLRDLLERSRGNPAPRDVKIHVGD